MDKKDRCHNKQESTYPKKRRLSSTSSSPHLSTTTTTAPIESAVDLPGETNPLRSPYGRCPNVSKRYKKISRIGEGTYGIVYKAIDQESPTQEIVALKRCLPHHEASDGFPITTLREIQILREISFDSGKGHENIVALKDVAVGTKRSSVFLVFEYVRFDMAQLIDVHYEKYSKSPFQLHETKRLALQLLSALEYLHARCIIHRDLKLSNLLYEKGLLKLADFGLARKTSPSCTSIDIQPEKRPKTSLLPYKPVEMILTPKVVSLWYRSPELLLNASSYTMAIDMWAAGCVIAELIFGKPLFRGKDELDQLGKIMDMLGPPNVRDWPELMDMPLVKSNSVEIPFLLQGHGQTSGQTIMPYDKMLDLFSDLSSSGIDLFQHLFTYNPHLRWSAKQASGCVWFREYPLPCHRDLMPNFDHKL